MKILFLTNSFPYPPIDGIKIKVFNLMRQLSKRHDLFLQSFYETPSDIEGHNIAHMKQYCKIVGLIPRKKQKFFSTRILWNVFGREPSFVKDFKSAYFGKILDDFVSSRQIDVLHFDGINIIPYIDLVANHLPTVISPNDSLSLALKDSTLYSPLKSFHRKIYYLSQLLNIRRYEKQNYNRFQKCYVVSDVDRIYLSQLSKQIDVEAIPNGVDTEFFKPLGIEPDYPSLIYTSNMGGGGADYAIRFIHRVLPRIKKVLPDIKLYLVGKNPQEKLMKIGKQDKNIIVTGFVQDVRPYIDKATLSVSPVMKSCGILNKVLEAMAMEKAVVGTKFSFYGIKDSIHRESMIAVNDDEEFANWIIRLMKYEKLRENIGRNARKLVKNLYTWDITAQRVEILYRQSIEKFYKSKNKMGQC